MNYKILQGDCRDVLLELIEQDVQVDSIVTDPPYELGFMNKAWDKTGIAYDIEMWKLCLQVLKPGGHLLSFGGSRTYHRMACAIEDAGFEIRDQIMWLYGQGFPKSLNLGDGFGTNLKPAHEPIVLARKPITESTIAANVIKHGTGGINIDRCRIAIDKDDPNQRPNGSISMEICSGKMFKNISGRNPAIGLNTLDMQKGRFPANVIHDGSEEVEDEFSKFQTAKAWGKCSPGKIKNEYFSGLQAHIPFRYDIGDGTPSRFFYCAKATKKERDGSKHPTVKPLALMKYLCRLVTPVNGTILDPFAGSGTTGQAALLEGFKTILIEKDEQYIADIQNRLKNRLEACQEDSKQKQTDIFQMMEASQ